jgi:hippurate hydrolase
MKTLGAFSVQSISRRRAKAKADNRLNELPVNHSPTFAPVIHPTLRTGIETLVVATRGSLSA